MIFNNRTYDILKWCCMIAIPAICTAVTQLGKLLGWEDAGIVAEIVVIICTFLGTLLGISNYQYYHTLPESMEIPDDQKIDEFENHEDGGVM